MARAISIVEDVFGRACLLDKDRRVGPHAHPEPHIVLKISGEDFDYQVGSQLAPCTRETIVLVNALELHSNHSRGKGHSVILALYLSPQWLIEQHPSLLSGGKLFERASCPLPARLRELADRLATEMMLPGVVKQERLQFLVSEIALCTFENYGRDIDAVLRFGKLNDFRIRRAVMHMRQIVAQPVDLAAVAAEVGLSRSRFFELFIACTGLSPKQYLDMLRMDLALNALAKTDQSIAEVSDACGYSAQSHFTRFFVHQIGITPGEYRRAASQR